MSSCCYFQVIFKATGTELDDWLRFSLVLDLSHSFLGSGGGGGWGRRVSLSLSQAEGAWAGSQ